MVVQSSLIIALLLTAFAYFYVKARNIFKLQHWLDGQVRQQQANFKMLVAEQQRLDCELGDLKIRSALINDMRLRVRDENQVIREQREVMQQILSDNKVILKRNELHLYNIKEATITTLKDYRRLTKLLSKLLEGDGPDSVDGLHELWLGAQLKVAAIETNFEDIFKQTPTQYLDSKGRVNDTDYSLN